MLNQSGQNKKPFSALLLLLALAPFQLAAKGCDVAKVGEDGCTEGQTCDGGPKGKTCGGLTGLACAADEYCDYAAGDACGAADATGVCKSKPEACDAILAPVCGCDDKSYSSACEANSAGVSVAKDGPCVGSDPGDGSCGGLTGQACAKGEYCEYPADAACGAADQTGVCKPAPEVCDDIYSPVCGCDGKTYSNACEANGAGASVASTGECKTEPDPDPDPGKSCGGLKAAACADGEFCAYPPDALCGAGDVTGVCTATPEACDAVYAPVCGCDGKTYGNECEANLAGTSPAKTGECEGTTPGGSCGGFIGEQCPGGQYCDYSKAGDCGFADGTGVCAEIPQGCTDQYDPVCGCDGETYSNACDAAAAGVTVASTGECE